MEGPEKKGKTGDGFGTLRVRLELKERILKLQNDHFTRFGKKISQTQLISAALDSIAGKSLVSQDRWQEMLAEILASGHKRAISAVQQNLLVFREVLPPAQPETKVRIPKK